MIEPAIAEPTPHRAERRRLEREHRRDEDRVARLLEALDVYFPEATSTIHVRTSKPTAAGYFPGDDGGRQRAVDAILPLIGVRDVWVNLNPFNAAIAASNACDRLQAGAKCPRDQDVLRIHRILIDFDAVRASNTASTDAEHAAALERMAVVRAELVRRGFSPDCFIESDSGNGGHLVLIVDLENSEADVALVRRFLRALGLRFSDAAVEIDLSTYNPGRVVKLPGTVATKGPNTAERPHRESILLAASATPAVASVDLLRSVADWYIDEPRTKAKDTSGDWPVADEWAARHGLRIASSGAIGDGTKHVLAVCPFNAEHDNRSALLIQWASGVIVFRCLHNSCAGNDWNALRDLCEPGWREAFKAGSSDRARGDAEQAGDVDRALRALQTLDAFEAIEASFYWSPYVIDEALTILCGDYGVAKTWVALAIAAARSRGRQLPCGRTGRIDRQIGTPERTLILTAENDPATLRFRIDRLGGDPSQITIWDTTVAPLPNLSDLTLLDASMERVKPRLVIIDPIQSALGPRVDINRANEVRPLLDRLVALARKHGCAVVVVMHLNKASTLSAKHRIMGSVDFAAAARSILVAAPLPDKPGARALVHLKCSVAKEGATLGYALEGDSANVVFTWFDKPVDVELDELLQSNSTKRTDTRCGAAAAFLRTILQDGPKSREHVMDAGREAGLSESAIKRAAESIGVRMASFGFPRTTTWELPGGGA